MTKGVRRLPKEVRSHARLASTSVATATCTKTQRALATMKARVSISETAPGREGQWVTACQLVAPLQGTGGAGKQVLKADFANARSWRAARDWDHKR